MRNTSFGLQRNSLKEEIFSKTSTFNKTNNLKILSEFIDRLIVS